MTNPVRLAADAKGPLALLNRACMIAGRYGWTPAKMGRALDQFVWTLKQFGGSATCPITAVAVERHPAILEKYQDQGIEFAVHGYTHVDYSQLAPEEQLAHLCHAREIFADVGITAIGFRSPYLRRETHLQAAIEAAGFSYASNQPVIWDVLDADALASSTYDGYERAIAFYNPWHASERLSLPQLCNQVVEIPVSLPDDEMLLDRLGGENGGLVEKAWQRILSETYRRGELFTVQLHPERTVFCADGFSTVLAEARTLTPSVWFARLDEIAAWWRARAGATVEIADADDGEFHLVVTGPGGTTVLARAVKVDAPTVPWADGYWQVKAVTFTARAPHRPFIGISPSASPALVSFLCQQGYIIETSEESHCYSYYFDHTEFTVDQERPLLAQIEGTDRPLIRLGRWPNGARSVLAVTGDIDALTLWDYGLRFFGR
jgi:peptidoglycan/xylan/chitin deacetylase (PgdA/CDA1 family)